METWAAQRCCKAHKLCSKHHGAKMCHAFWKRNFLQGLHQKINTTDDLKRLKCFEMSSLIIFSSFRFTLGRHFC